MSTKSNPLSSTRFLTIPQRYAKLRARCPIPPEPWKKRQGRPRKVVSAVLSSVLHIEPWEYDPPETPLVAGLRHRLAESFVRYRQSTRPLTPMVVDLEKRLAARVGLPRQKPTARVDFGNVSRVGDAADDVPEPQMPPGERM